MLVDDVVAQVEVHEGVMYEKMSDACVDTYVAQAEDVWAEGTSAGCTRSKLLLCKFHYKPPMASIFSASS